MRVARLTLAMLGCLLVGAASAVAQAQQPVGVPAIPPIPAPAASVPAVAAPTAPVVAAPALTEAPAVVAPVPTYAYGPVAVRRLYRRYYAYGPPYYYAAPYAGYYYPGYYGGFGFTYIGPRRAFSFAF